MTSGCRPDDSADNRVAWRDDRREAAEINSEWGPLRRKKKGRRSSRATIRKVGRLQVAKNMFVEGAIDSISPATHTLDTRVYKVEQWTMFMCARLCTYVYVQLSNDQYFSPVTSRGAWSLGWGSRSIRVFFLFRLVGPFFYCGHNFMGFFPYT